MSKTLKNLVVVGLFLGCAALLVPAIKHSLFLGEENARLEKEHLALKEEHAALTKKNAELKKQQDQILSRPALVRFDALPGDELPFETFGLVKEASCNQYRVTQGKAEPIFGSSFGTQLFVDLQSSFPQWLVDNKIAVEGDSVYIYRGYPDSGSFALRIVIMDADDKRRLLDESVLQRIDDGLVKNDYTGYARQKIDHDNVYAWSLKTKK